MALGRIFRASMVEVGPQARIYYATLDGQTLPRGRVLRATLEGTAKVLLETIPSPQQREPLETVSITAVLLSGGTPTWTWRQISGPTVTLSGSGATRSFKAPATYTGLQVVLGVRATVAGQIGDESIIVINIPAQVTWSRRGAGGWVPERITPSL